MTVTLKLPRRTLMVLSGPAGCGKSTFATQRCISTAIVSSDDCRERICDDSTNQQVNRDAFDLFYYIINKRLFNGRFTVADSTALKAVHRLTLLDIARRHRYRTCLVVFNISLETCLERNRVRERRVEESVIVYHMELLRQAWQVIPEEGWDQVQILDEQQSASAVLEVDER